VLWIRGLTVVLLVLGREKIAVLSAITVELLHQSAMDTCTDSSVVSTG